MGDLAECMHAGIGASGAGNRDALAGEGRDRVGERALHGDAVVLRLPADKRRAVVFDGELVAGHASSAQHAAAPNRGAAQEFFRRHRLPAGALQFEQSRTAPLPQAIVNLSSSTRPGSPAPSPLVVRNTLMRPAPASSNQAPGNGDSPRQ